MNLDLQVICDSVWLVLQALQTQNSLHSVGCNVMSVSLQCDVC